MVDHVKGRQVGELLTAQEEEGVDEVDELGEEVPPGHVGGIEPVLGVGVVDRLTEPAVLPWQVTDIQSHCQYCQPFSHIFILINLWVNLVKMEK